MKDGFITVVGMVGLLLDLIGVIVLFFDRDKGLGKIHNPIRIKKINFSTRAIKLQSKHTPEDVIKENVENINGAISQLVWDVNCVIGEINLLIEKAEILNNKRHKESQKWLILIISGYALQLLAVVLHLVCRK